MLDDVPKPSERVFVYKIDPSTWSFSFIDYRDRTGRDGRYESGEYVWYKDAPSEICRDNGLWRAWCMTEADRLEIEYLDPIKDLPHDQGGRFVVKGASS